MTSKLHFCVKCGNKLNRHQKLYCSRQCYCATPRSEEHKKTGPKIDLKACEKRLKKTLFERRPDYEVVMFGYEKSTFRHFCGREFEASNSAMIRVKTKERNNRHLVYCFCQSRKPYRTTLESLQQKFRSKGSVWEPVEYTEGSKTAIFEHDGCLHRCELPIQFAAALKRCKVCYSNPMASGVRTDVEYRQMLVREKPDFELVGEYVDSKTMTRYKHKRCGQEFSTIPDNVKRPRFVCPVCTSKSTGRLYDIKRGGKVFRLRGMEGIALDWILRNTKIKAKDILCDGNKEVTSIEYYSSQDRKYRRYEPDFYVERLKLFIEVKGPVTLGLSKHPYYGKDSKYMWTLCQDKAKAVIGKGYRYKMLVFNSYNSRISIPKNWYKLSHKTVLDWSSSKSQML